MWCYGRMYEKNHKHSKNMRYINEKKYCKNISFSNYSMSSSRRIDNTDLFYIVKDLMIKN